MTSGEEAPQLLLGSSWSAWVAAGDFSALQGILPAYLERCRWFGGKSRGLSTTVVRAALVLAGPAVDTLFVIEAVYADGTREAYHLPLTFVGEPEAAARGAQPSAGAVAQVYEARSRTPTGILSDAFQSAEFRRALMARLQGWRLVDDQDIRLRVEVSPWLRENAEFMSRAFESRLLQGEQSNTSVIYGEQFILKMYRKVEVGRHPELELGRFLTERGFQHAPRVAGWLEYTSGPGGLATLACVSEFASGARDAWRYTCEALTGYRERVLSPAWPRALPSWPGQSLVEGLDAELPAGVVSALGAFEAFSGLLGRRTAELHLALASDTTTEEMAPEPFDAPRQHAAYSALQQLSERVFRELRGARTRLPPAVQEQVAALLDDEPRLCARFEAFRTLKLQALRIRHHGDYHLGQVLFTGQDFLIIDFEGEPARPLAERRLKGSAVRDLAGMLRSFHYAAASTLAAEASLGVGERARLAPWVDLWYRGVSTCFLKHYLETAGAAPFVPPTREELRLLLDVLLLEKALSEVSYELHNRPEWLPIPLRGVRAILGSAVSES